MSGWSLAKLLANLHNDLEQRLQVIRQSLEHPGTKGNASESVWLGILRAYLPLRYQVDSAHIVDSNGLFSQQIDIVVYDRQYSPLIFDYAGEKIIPAESVYAVFEAKQTIDANVVRYASDKILSVRCLHRTSMDIPHAGGEYLAKPLIHIYGGVLTLDSEWNPPLGKPLLDSLSGVAEPGRIDMGCVAAHGCFMLNNNEYEIKRTDKAATFFLLNLIARLQASGTVPMIDVQAYAKWLC